MVKSDLTVIGAGIVGVATALQLTQRFPHLSVTLVDKEPRPARHQTGHNSGVVHAGVYYKPGSLKADFCKRGAELTKNLCRRHKIPYLQCGKLLVATDDLEYQRMIALEQRCGENRIEVERLSEADLRTLEPHIVGVGALLVKSTAITDFTVITETLLKSFEKSNGTALMGAEVISIEEDRKSVRIKTASTIVESSYLILCGGLMADRLAKMMAIDLDFRIIPFRGEYYQLSPQFNNIVSHLIYPIPDPDLPFLGVHLTMMVDGTVTVGPNAVLGWKREGYGKLNFSLRDVSEMAAFPGFWKVLKANLSTGFEEFLDSLYKPGYLKRVRKYCPQLKLSDLTPYPAGIRAQAVMSDGELVHDFLFSETERSLHVCNAPSPAATSALPIGAYLCDKAAVKFRL
ncbi:MAG: L-2-hydroxyglutarate oxidase [Desulfofustis sp.]|nr:L-2-hydroxyglutarate oxidase [Desulfofustis sp.]MBT8355269.1 L-2-hydroxyglutarate oxidase [Desulfofustis sp.]NNK57782.1 L-2-hydroxyglutarate oxidase [Desulfofustis sp.]